MEPNYKKLFQECIWNDVKCGDIVYLSEGEMIPADIVLL